MKPALLVIDVLNDFFREGRLAERRAGLCAAINALAGRFRDAGLPVIWVRQEFAPDLSDAFLLLRRTGRAVTVAGTDGCRLLPELQVAPDDHEIVKKRYSAFFGTPLAELLAGLGVDALVLAGVNTHACIRSTAVDAYQRDLPVFLAAECVDSYDPEYHRESLRYLAQGIATVCDSAGLCQELGVRHMAAGS